MKAMKIATKSLKFTDKFGSGEIVKGERIDPDHELVRMFPHVWRDYTTADELKIRSTRVAELREQATRPAGREALSEAGRQARREDDFWRSTTALLERTREDQPPAEERREQAFYDRALQQLEDSDAARMRDERIALNEAWHGRLEE